MIEIIKDHLKATAKSERLDDYVTPSWDYKQAHRNGYKQHAQTVLDLFKFGEE